MLVVRSRKFVQACSPGGLLSAVALWLPITTEYRIALLPKLELPLRLLTGLALQKAGVESRRVGEVLMDQCEDLRSDGAECSVSGPPGVGVVFGAGPGLAYQLGAATLRVDLTVGYVWLRLVKQQVHDDGFALSDQSNYRSLLTALSFAAEL